MIVQHANSLSEWAISQPIQGLSWPFYYSVDVRQSAHKAAVVDANLFPAGFNNLCTQDHEKASNALLTALHLEIPHAKKIVLVTEEHTRNTWYLENVFTLQSLLEKAGLEVITASFLDPNFYPPFGDAPFAEFETAMGNRLKLYALTPLVEQIKNKTLLVDAFVLNNDLTSGLPQHVIATQLPLIPSPYAGWHSRLKSGHFQHVNALATQWAQTQHSDPWLITTLFKSTDAMSINDDENRAQLSDMASDLLNQIKAKYTEYGISSKPLLFLKAEAGTYGMGVEPIEDASEILSLNRKIRNNLSKGKGSTPITRFLLQEGIPSELMLDQHVAEPCMYFSGPRSLGGFYRLNSQKDNRSNLNSQGMMFKPLCAHPNQNHPLCGYPPTDQLPLWIALGQLSGLALTYEIHELESLKESFNLQKEGFSK